MSAQDFSITGGTVAIEDAIKHKGYDDPNFAPSRKVKVELHFTVPEGDKGTEYLDAVSGIAQSKLSQLLGTSVVVTAKAEVVLNTAGTAASEGQKKRGPKKVPELSDKDKLAQAAGVLEGDTTTPAAKEDELDDLLGDSAPIPVTDAELGKAAQEKNAKMKAELGEKWAPVKIRTLITKFAGEGKRINDIPAAKRHEFLEKLKALA